MTIDQYLAKHYQGKAPAVRRAEPSGACRHDNGGNASTQRAIHGRSA